MIQISKIDDGLSIYRNKKIVIWGTGANSLRLYKMLRFFDVTDIVAFCDNDVVKWGENYLGYEIISPRGLLNFYKTENILVSIGCGAETGAEGEIVKQLENMGIKEYIRFSEAMARLHVLRLKRIRNYHMSPLTDQLSLALHNYVAHSVDNELCMLCLPEKTGDTTLMKTFNKIGQDFFLMEHRPELFDIIKNFYWSDNFVFKIVTAVREPISQNLSMTFQNIGIGVFEFVRWYVDDEDYWKEGGDYQKIFNKDIAGYLKKNNADKLINERCFFMIQSFISRFCENILNLFDYEFDKAKGYSIIKKGNVEVFVYQLEKLNKISENLFHWLDIPETELICSNIGDNKWYAKAYQQAKKEIKFSQKYFDKCYDEPYVKHFYSEEDIQKFKDKWKDHVTK